MPIEIAETVDTITPKILKQAFVRWQQAQEPPTVLLNLEILSGVATQSATTKSIFLFDFIFDIVMGQLSTLRELAQIPHQETIPVSLEEISAILARDFGAGQQNPMQELAAWSALFHRYLLPVRIQPKVLAEAAGISDRSLRRHLALGLRYLTQKLRRMELATSQQAERITFESIVQDGEKVQLMRPEIIWQKN